MTSDKYKKKILIIANSTFPIGMANSVNVFRMTSAFNALGHDVTLYSLRSASLFKTGLWRETCRRFGVLTQVRTHLLWWPFQRGAEPFLALVALFVLVCSHRRLIVFTRIRYVAAIGVFLGFKTYFESHAPPQSRLQKRIDQWLLKAKGCKFIGISQGLINAYGKLELNTEKIYLAPDAGRVHRAFPPQEREFYGPALDIGYIGSLYVGRGLEIIVALAEQCPDRHFHIIGRLNENTVPSKGRLSNLTFYDEVSPNQADRLAILFDALLMPYQKEVTIGNGTDTSTWMSPMKMFEFMLAGRPIVASRLPAICEILKDSEDALLVNSSDKAGWKEALLKLDDPKLRWRLALNSYHKASQQHTWEVRANFILENHHGK